MNTLWEAYILVSLKQAAGNLAVYGQQSKIFWKHISIRPDIIIQRDNAQGQEIFVIDTKWKNIDNADPSTHDLRQMYVYNDYWNCKKAMLLYPAQATSKANFESFTQLYTGQKHHACSLGKISIFKSDGKTLNEEIGQEIINFFIDAPPSA